MLYELQSVSVIFGNKLPALDHVNLEIPAGGTVIISGNTGAGKTTLLKLLHTELNPGMGKIYFKKHEIITFNRRTKRLIRQISGMIYQDPKFIDDLNCYDNVMIPMILNGNSREKAHENCLNIMLKLGISYLRTKMPYELSLGEQKLVSAARGLVHRPEIILADEPTENFDRKSKEALFSVFKDASARGATLVIASNDELLHSTFKNAQKFYISDGKLIQR